MQTLSLEFSVIESFLSLSRPIRRKFIACFTRHHLSIWLPDKNWENWFWVNLILGAERMIVHINNNWRKNSIELDIDNFDEFLLKYID
jgi:hypothetical protein